MWFLFPLLYAGYQAFKGSNGSLSFGNLKETSANYPAITKGDYVGAPLSKGAIDSAAMAKFQANIKMEEGTNYVVYLDTKGIPTAGIGHKITSSDKLKVGDKVTYAQVMKWFGQDTAKAFTAAQSQAKQASQYTVDFIVALASVNYQLGTGWTSKFANTWKDIKAGHFSSAISRLRQSDWASQTPKRVENFITALNKTITTNGVS
jgi:lysozyme